VAFHDTTDPYIANPFAETADDPRELSRKISIALGRARKRLSGVREPDLFWEEPGLHGHGRQIDLRRGRVPASQLTRRFPGASGSLNLPPPPSSMLTVGQTAAIVGGAVALFGLLVWWMKKQHDKALTAHVGEDGLEFLGIE
jgi:hypothetical protein